MYTCENLSITVYCDDKTCCLSCKRVWSLNVTFLCTVWRHSVTLLCTSWRHNVTFLCTAWRHNVNFRCTAQCHNVIFLCAARCHNVIFMCTEWRHSVTLLCTAWRHNVTLVCTWCHNLTFLMYSMMSQCGLPMYSMTSRCELPAYSTTSQCDFPVHSMTSQCDFPVYSMTSQCDLPVYVQGDVTMWPFCVLHDVTMWPYIPQGSPPRQPWWRSRTSRMTVSRFRGCHQSVTAVLASSATASSWMTHRVPRAGSRSRRSTLVTFRWPALMGWRRANLTASVSMLRTRSGRALPRSWDTLWYPGRKCVSAKAIHEVFGSSTWLVHLIEHTTLTHWGRMTHICVGKITIIVSDNGLSPGRRQAIIRTNAGLLLIGPLGTNVSEILIEILTFSFKKIRFKVSSAKRRPFCLGLNVLSSYYWDCYPGALSVSQVIATHLRIGTRRWNLRVSDLHKSCSDLTAWQEARATMASRWHSQ